MKKKFYKHVYKKGENFNNSKLTDSDVREIRKKLKQGEKVTALASIHINTQHIHRILYRLI